jgi:hypothetical protein
MPLLMWNVEIYCQGEYIMNILNAKWDKSRGDKISPELPEKCCGSSGIMVEKI